MWNRHSTIRVNGINPAPEAPLGASASLFYFLTLIVYYLIKFAVLFKYNHKMVGVERDLRRSYHGMSGR